MHRFLFCFVLIVFSCFEVVADTSSIAKGCSVAILDGEIIGDTYVSCGGASIDSKAFVAELLSLQKFSGQIKEHYPFYDVTALGPDNDDVQLSTEVDLNSNLRLCAAGLTRIQVVQENGNGKTYDIINFLIDFRYLDVDRVRFYMSSQSVEFLIGSNIPIWSPYFRRVECEPYGGDKELCRDVEDLTDEVSEIHAQGWQRKDRQPLTSRDEELWANFFGSLKRLAEICN